jgi:thiamine biosynthesis lipoprotein
MPVVNYWGFGYTGREKVTEADSIKINSLLQSVGFNKLHKQGKVILKDNPLTELDFSGIAKGYGVDKIAEHLASKGLKNYYVEIGGEVFAKGVNSKGITWRTGIGIPSSEANPLEFQEILELENKGIATSGNYRNYYEANGKKVSHTINPENGLPERNELLSATIIAPTCAEADGYATACMVLGLQKAIRMIEDDDQLEGILIYGGENGIYQVYDSNKK